MRGWGLHCGTGTASAPGRLSIILAEEMKMLIKQCGEKGILLYWLSEYTHMEEVFDRDRAGNAQKTQGAGEGGHEEFLINAGKVTGFGKVNLRTILPWSTKSGLIYPGTWYSPQ